MAGGPTRLILRWEFYEVQLDGKRTRFFFDTDAFRRGISGKVDKPIAMQQALAFSGLTEDQIEVDPEQPWPPPWSL